MSYANHATEQRSKVNETKMNDFPFHTVQTVRGTSFCSDPPTAFFWGLWIKQDEWQRTFFYSRISEGIFNY